VLSNKRSTAKFPKRQFANKGMKFTLYGVFEVLPAQKYSYFAITILIKASVPRMSFKIIFRYFHTFAISDIKDG